MKTFLQAIVSAVCLLPVAALAQKWEFGAVGAGSLYTSRTVTNGSASADAGFSSGYGFGVMLGQNMYKYIGGELRYGFLSNELKIESGGAKATFGGQAHLIHYDFLFHTAPVGAKVRPFVAGGGGVKYYRGTGTEVLAQPLSNLALLTRTNEIRPLVSVGAGVKIQLSPRVQVRIEVRDYMTQFPTEVITPNRGSSVSGWIHNLVPMAGISYLF